MDKIANLGSNLLNLLFGLMICTIALAGCVGAPVGAAMVAGAPTVDRGLNAALGSKSGKTITSDDDDLRKQGDTAAASRCQLYDIFLWPADMLYLAGEDLSGDHCERWNRYETKELAKD